LSGIVWYSDYAKGTVLKEEVNIPMRIYRPDVKKKFGSLAVEKNTQQISKQTDASTLKANYF
jgi:hypothetical protein